MKRNQIFSSVALVGIYTFFGVLTGHGKAFAQDERYKFHLDAITSGSYTALNTKCVKNGNRFTSKLIMQQIPVTSDVSQLKVKIKMCSPDRVVGVRDDIKMFFNVPSDLFDANFLRSLNSKTEFRGIKVGQSRATVVVTPMASTPSGLNRPSRGEKIIKIEWQGTRLKPVFLYYRASFSGRGVSGFRVNQHLGFTRIHTTASRFGYKFLFKGNLKEIED